MKDALPNTSTVAATVELRMPTGPLTVGRWVALKNGKDESLWQITSIVEFSADESMQIVLAPLVLPDA